MTVPARGEVWWSESPDFGRRPVLIVQRDSAIARLHSVLGAPITRTIRGVPSELRLGPDDGLPQDCAASFDNLRPFRRSMLVERVCMLSPVRMAEACFAMNAAVDC